ncbi:MAG: Glu/Leu/Phe/Val dehydrogenase dimerization domain-containing protein [Haliea sp.]
MHIFIHRITCTQTDRLNCSDHPEFYGHEDVYRFEDTDTDLRAIIAVHSTTLGPAAGGCRRWTYESEAEALTDALRLSRGMSYKNAMAGLPFGGGKAVILAGPTGKPTPEEFRAFGQFVQSLNGQYVTAEDVGVGTDDMRVVREVTPYVSGLPQSGSGAGGDPSPWTALGVYLSVRKAISLVFGAPDVRGFTVGVQGAGHVGYRLCQLLHEAGARLLVADINPENTERVVAQFGAIPVASSEILAAEVDVLAPCALGGILNANTIPHVRAQIVAGAANNQLATPEDAWRLHARSVVFLPDYVINAGGIISVAREYLGGSTREELEVEVAKIPARLDDLLTRANRKNLPPSVLTDQVARSLIAAPKQN